MTFENNLISQPSLLAQVRRHLPIILVGFGFLTAFVALHTAAVGVVIVAGGHGAIGLAVLLVRYLRSDENLEATAEAEVQI